jgi:hypothetical protein
MDASVLYEAQSLWGLLYTGWYLEEFSSVFTWVLPCQYHSTSAPYSSVYHRPETWFMTALLNGILQEKQTPTTDNTSHHWTWSWASSDHLSSSELSWLCFTSAITLTCFSRWHRPDCVTCHHVNMLQQMAPPGLCNVFLRTPGVLHIMAQPTFRKGFFWGEK